MLACLPFIGLYIHPWHTYGRDILRGVARFVADRPDWECHLPWPGASRPAVLPAGRLDGLIVRIGGTHDVPARFGAELPRVTIASTNLLATPVDIAWDNRRVGESAADHLLEQGHRIVVAAGELSTQPYQRQRVDGLVAALATRQIDVRRLDLDRARPAAVRALLRGLPRPAALFCATDPLAGGLLRVARALGRRVPEDLAVVAAGDDEPYCDLLAPPLSSVALPGEAVGFLAAERLHELLTRGTRPSPAVVAPRYVTVRRSSDVLAIDDEPVARAVRTIRQRATQGLTAAAVHAAVPLSRRGLEVRFKKVVGRTIEQEILRVKLNAAKRLLTDTDRPMAEVADRSGFASAQRLSAVFAREQGLPPSAYRRRQAALNPTP